jgi:Holliday junction resolvase RusA-like endonuclease
MTKKEKEYISKYGHIPKDMSERLLFAIDELKMNVKDIGNIKRFILDILSLSSWNEMGFIFYFVPEGAPRPRSSKWSKSFYVKGSGEDANFFENCLKEIKEYEPIITPCKFNSDIFLPIPNDMSRIEKFLSELRLIRPVCTPDWDNIGKKYSDMIQHGLLVNDSIIVDGRVRKYYSFKPRVEISIEYLVKHDSKYNKRKIESWKHYKELNITDRESVI